MSFGVPLALWGLVLLPLLILLERWRRRPKETVWPSLLLWRAIAEAETPARRRIERLLLYECAAVLILCLAAAEPAIDRGFDERTAVVLLDEGAHMQARRADGRTALEATRVEIERIRGAVDQLVTHPVRGDVARAAAGMPGGDLRVLATDRLGVEGAGYVVVGRAPHGFNLGIDAVEVEGDRLWFAVATDGPARAVRVRVGDREQTVPTGRGAWTAFAKEIEILTADNYDGDDFVRLRRLDLVARNETRSDLVRIALFHAGLRARAGDDAELVITGEGGTPVPGAVHGSDCVAVGPLFDELLLDDCVWRGVRALAGPGLLTYGDRALARWMDERTLWLGLPVNRDWDDYDTLAVLVERAKRARVQALLRDGEALVGDAVASPAPHHVRTNGVDRPWDGHVPEARRSVAGASSIRAILAGLAALVLVLYLRALR